MPNASRFLWVYLVLDIILHDCRNANETRRAAEKLPTRLEELYMTFLNRKHRDAVTPLYDPILLMYVCIATNPMHQMAVRQLLALDPETGVCSDDNIPTRHDVLVSGVSLVILDQAEGLIHPLHETVRDFVFSTNAITCMETLLAKSPHYKGAQVWADHSLEEAMRLHLGKLCLVHIQSMAGRVELTSIAVKGVPISLASAPPLQRVKPLLDALMPYSSNKSKIDLNIPVPNDPSSTKGFLRYAIHNWIQYSQALYGPTSSDRRAGAAIQQTMSESRRVAQKAHRDFFTAIATRSDFPWKLHPWTTSAQTLEEHMTGLFAYSVANDHVPLLRAAIQKRHLLPGDVFYANLHDHGSLPALHVACKAGNVHVLWDLLQVCQLDIPNHPLRPALHYAIAFGQLSCVKLILRRYTRWEATKLIDQPDSHGQTLLHLATCSGHEDVIAHLVNQEGANICVEDNYGAFPAEYAMDASLDHCLHLLINKEVIHAFRESDHNGTTKLMVAAEAGYAKRVAALLAYVDAHAKSLAGFMVYEKEGYYIKRDQRHTAMELARFKKHDSVVETLARSVHFNKQLEWLVTQPKSNVWPHCSWLSAEWTPVECAIFERYHSGSWKQPDDDSLMQLVMQDAKTPSRDVQDFYHKLQSAAEVGHFAAVQHLLLVWRRKPEQLLYQPWEPGEYVNAYFYRRLMDLRGFYELDLQTPFPVATYLAAMRQHTAVLALLTHSLGLQERRRLLEKSQTLRSCPNNLSQRLIRCGIDGWYHSTSDQRRRV